MTRRAPIRAALGRFFARCIAAHEDAKWQAKLDAVDFGKMTDAQISAWVHGRPHEQPACERRPR